MRFKVLNLTEGTITATATTSRSQADIAAALPLTPNITVQLPNHRRKYLHLHPIVNGLSESEKVYETFDVPLPGLWATRGASWREIIVPGGCPWRVYCFWPRKTLVILPHRKLESFLSDMPDTLTLSALMLPGTHDTMAFYGWPISQCQSPTTPLSTQFLSGIRVIDIRLAVIPVINTLRGRAPDPALPAAEFKLIAYHGIYPQRTPFPTMLSSIHTFLTSPAGSRETIVMSIKQEDFTITPAPTFSRLVKEDLMRAPGGFKDTDSNGNRDTGIYFLENRIPTLGEVRGKVVLMSRFGGNGAGWEGGLEGIGIHPTIWPDSNKSGFVWDLKGTTVRTHDWYAIPSFLAIPEKAALSTQVLLPSAAFPLTLPQIASSPSTTPLAPSSPAPNTTEPILNITYLSAASFPLALPPIVARGSGWPGWKLGFEGVNARVGRWLLESLVPEFALDKFKNNGGKGNLKGNDEKKLRWFRQNDGKKASTPLLSPGMLSAIQDSEELNSYSTRMRGWALMDYFSYDKGLVPLLVECNYRARKAGDEGWA